MDFMNISLYFLLLLSKIKRILVFFIGLYKNKLPLLLSISNSNISDYLSNALVNIPKFPNQISLIIQEDISLESLSNILLWSFSIGISCISIYDIKGNIIFLKGNLLNKMTKKLTSYAITSPISIYLLSEKNKLQSSNNELCVILLGCDSPKAMLVDCAKYLSCQSDNSIIKEADIDSYFAKMTRIENPDLSINFGNDCSLNGLMPWQSGNTELIFHPTHHQISVSDYIELLSNFANRNQRWGK